MDTATFDISPLSSPFPSPNVAALLKIKIITWSQETGFPVSLCVRVADKTFNLHKYPLISKSGYFNRTLGESNEIKLPKDFPGGPETFEMISLFIYGSSTLVDPFNVAALRCAAEFLEMTEDYCSGNLCQRFDIYLNQVVLQSWDDTLIVLRKCQTLLPWAEDLLIVSRCIESLAFMSCMEILDPERRRNQPVVTLEVLASQAWSCQKVKETVRQDLWIKDLIELPFRFFKRIIGSLRRQGMREKYVSPIVLFYADKWIQSTKTRQSLGDKNGNENTNNKDLTVFQGVISLLPMGEKASKAIPVGFYLSLLSRSLQFGLASKNIQAKLQDQIASILHTAYLEDFLFPATGSDSFSSSIELATMENIFSTYVAFNMDSDNIHSLKNSIVAELWDAYLTHIATDPTMSLKRIMDLVEMVPMSCRQNHDHLYHALDTFLQVHKDLTQEEKAMVCKNLKCQKLSPEVCIQAVQNNLMPLRLVVQALFVQQLNTHQTLKECSDSFRYEAHCKEFSGSLPRSQNLEDYASGETGSRPLNSFPQQKDSTLQRSEFSQKDYESTSFRIQTLEQELTTLKTRLEMQNILKAKNPSSANPQESRSCNLDSGKKRNPLTSCIGSVNFSSQRKHASRLLKLFRRISLFSSGRRLHRKTRTG